MIFGSIHYLFSLFIVYNWNALVQVGMSLSYDDCLLKANNRCNLVDIMNHKDDPQQLHNTPAGRIDTSVEDFLASSQVTRINLHLYPMYFDRLTENTVITPAFLGGSYVSFEKEALPALLNIAWIDIMHTIRDRSWGTKEMYKLLKNMANLIRLEFVEGKGPVYTVVGVQMDEKYCTWPVESESSAPGEHDV